MKKLFLFCSLLFYLSCSSSHSLTYKPDIDNKLWNIRIEKGDITDQFEVYVNETKIIEETPNFFSNEINESVMFGGEEVRLMVNYSSGCLGIGSGYNTSLLINNQLIGQFSF